MKKIRLLMLLVSASLVLVLAACAAPAPAPATTYTSPDREEDAVYTSPDREEDAVYTSPDREEDAIYTQAPTPAPTPEKMFEWTYYHTSALAGHPYYVDALDKLEEMSGGRIKFNRLEGGQAPYKSADLLPAVRDRLLDAAYQNFDYVAHADLRPSVMSLPYLLSGDPDEFIYIFEQVRGDVWDNVLADYNQMSGWYMARVNYSFLGNRFVSNAEEAKGAKFRTLGKALAAKVEALDVTAVVLPWGDVFDAIQRGMIDGVVITVGGGGVRYKLFEVVDKVTRTPGMPGTPQALVINLDAFNELPPDLQQIVREWGVWATEYCSHWEFDTDALMHMVGMDEFGVQMKTMSPSYIESRKPYIEEVWNSWVAETPGGEEILQKVLALHEEWLKTKE